MLIHKLQTSGKWYGYIVRDTLGREVIRGLIVWLSGQIIIRILRIGRAEIIGKINDSLSMDDTVVTETSNIEVARVENRVWNEA